MFGLSTKEILTNAIKNACEDCIENYKQALINGSEVSVNQCEGDTENRQLLLVRREYFNDVSRSVLMMLGTGSQKIRSRALAIIASPGLCGNESIKAENGLSAGELYAVCHFAMKNKPATPDDCAVLDHLQEGLIQRVHDEVGHG
jgi:hypothetical protein